MGDQPGRTLIEYYFPRVNLIISHVVEITLLKFPIILFIRLNSAIILKEYGTKNDKWQTTTIV